MQTILSILDVTGHTEIQFRDDGVLVEWSDTSLKERRGLRELIAALRAKGGVTKLVDDSGVVGEITKLVPGTIRNKTARVIVQGVEAIEHLRELSKGMVDDQIKSGRLVMEMQKSGEWKLLRVGDFKLDPEATKKEPQKVVAHQPVGGG